MRSAPPLVDQAPPQPLRVLHVITRLIVGGAQENTVSSVLGLCRKPDLSLRLISGPTFGSEGSLVPQVAAIPDLHDTLPSLVRPISPWNDFKAWRALQGICRSWQPDLIHTHSGKAGILGRLAAHRAGVPLIVHTIHGPSFGSFQGSLANAIYLRAERWAGRCTTHFVSVAQAMTDQYLAAGIGRPEIYSLIHSGFNLEPFLAATNDPLQRTRWQLEPDAIVVGCIARLAPLKGHEDLLAVAPALVAECPKLRFLLVGDGPRRAELEREVHQRGLQSYFRFTGLIPPEQIPALVGIMDLLIHLSRREGLPRALPQALAARRPVVAYDCDGAREICLNEKTGLLIAPGDLAALRQAVLRLATSPALRAQFGEAGCELVRERFSVEQMVEQLHTLYLKLAALASLPRVPSGELRSA